jgi:hypothetical protein
VTARGRARDNKRSWARPAEAMHRTALGSPRRHRGRAQNVHVALSGGLGIPPFRGGRDNGVDDHVTPRPGSPACAASTARVP